MINKARLVARLMQSISKRPELFKEAGITKGTLTNALARASALFHYYKTKSPRIVEKFWNKVMDSKDNVDQIHHWCDLLMTKLGGKAGMKAIKGRQFLK